MQHCIWSISLAWWRLELPRFHFHLMLWNRGPTSNYVWGNQNMPRLAISLYSVPQCNCSCHPTRRTSCLSHPIKWVHPLFELGSNLPPQTDSRVQSHRNFVGQLPQVKSAESQISFCLATFQTKRSMCTAPNLSLCPLSPTVSKFTPTFRRFSLSTSISDLSIITEYSLARDHCANDDGIALLRRKQDMICIDGRGCSHHWMCCQWPVRIRQVMALSSVYPHWSTSRLLIFSPGCICRRQVQQYQVSSAEYQVSHCEHDWWIVY